MKKFTVKDFIAYNNPCFSCNKQINFKIGFIDMNSSTTSYLRPVVANDYTEINLSIKYHNWLKLYIFHKTNKILTNNKRALTKYLDEHKLFLSSTCDYCYTHVESLSLDFNMEISRVAAVGINVERLMVNDGKNIYRISSSFENGKSSLVVDRLDKATPLSPFVLDLPLLPKYKFKNKQHFIDKIKTYITFS